MTKKKYWASFWWNPCAMTADCWWPWWVSGYRGDDFTEESICVAIIAKDEDEVRRELGRAFPNISEWRFVNERPESWDPQKDGGGRFTLTEWMKWPDGYVGPSDKVTP